MPPTFRASHWIPPRGAMLADAMIDAQEYARLWPTHGEDARARAAAYRRAARHALRSGLRDHARYLVAAARATLVAAAPSRTCLCGHPFDEHEENLYRQVVCSHGIGDRYPDDCPCTAFVEG